MDSTSTADKIVAEVKSQGVFDQFRKDSIQTIDTKPAYINLIQRVQSTVHNFLASKVWSPDMNKIQMRERLRRHITESSFLELGIERIVDQVVNPKISTTFQPQIENIAYVALGIDKPKTKNEEHERHHQQSQNSVSVIIPNSNGNLMPEELEQISPDSDKMTIKSDSHNSKGSDTMDTSDDKTEDFESPEFEPIENNSNDNLEEQKPSIKTEIKVEIKTENDNYKADVTQESNLSQISSLSIESEDTNLHASISEEAQMPRFSENSNSLTEVTTKSSNFAELAFNIKKDEIKFEGTERKIKVESPENFPDEKPEEKVYVEEIKVKTERNGSDSNIVDGASVIKFNKEKSRDHHQSSSSSHKKSSSSRDRDRERERDRRSDRNDKDRKHYSSSSSYKKSGGHSSSKDRHSSSSSSKSKSKSTEKNGSSKDKHSRNNDKCSSKPSVFRRKSTDSNDDNAGADKKSSSYTSNGSRAKVSSCVEEIKQSGGASDSTSPSENVNLPVSDCADLLVSETDNFPVPGATDSVPETHHSPGSVTLEPQESNSAELPESSGTENFSVPDAVSLSVSVIDNSTASDGACLPVFAEDNAVSTNISSTSEAANLSVCAIDNAAPFDAANFSACETENLSASEDRTISAQVLDSTCFQSADPPTNDAVVTIDELPLHYFDSPISLPLDEDFELDDSKLIRLAKVFIRPEDASSICSYRSTESVCSTPSLKRKLDSEPETVTETKATLIIDCVDYANYEYAHKKFKSSLNKVSPTPSELSVGSKENECVKKDMGSGLRKPVERKSIVSNQRYSSEDLYKPRPILSQRSRRRGIDNNVL